MLKKYIKNIQVFFLTLIGVLVLSGVSVEATPIYNMPKTEVVNSNTRIDAKYSFVPIFEPGVTVLKTTAPGMWKKLPWGGGDNRMFRSFDVTQPGADGYKRNLFAIYENVGYYKGEKVDLKIQINDWKLHKDHNNGGNISFEEEKIAMSTKGFEWVDVGFLFVKAGTDTRVTPAGYFTFSDIDLHQGISFIRGTFTEAIDKFLVESRSNKLKYHQPHDDWYKVYDTTGIIDIPDNIYDANHSFTFLYESHQIRFRWETDWSKEREPRYASSTTAVGDYFFYVNDKPAPTDPSPPTKTVDMTEMNYATDKDKEIVYRINHTVPPETDTSRYSDYKFIDQIDKNLDIVSINVKDPGGRNLNGNFLPPIVKKTEGHRTEVIVKPSATTLKQDKFYGKEYVYEIRTKLKKDKMLEEFKSRNQPYRISNIGSVTVGNENRQSNVVYTNVNPAPTVLKPTKTVNMTEMNYATDKDKEIVYRINHTVPPETDTSRYSDYEFVDYIDKVLDIVSVNVKDPGGRNLNANFVSSVTKTGGTNLKVLVKPSDATLNQDSFYGKEYVYEIRAKLNKDILLAEFESMGRPYYPLINIGNVTVGNEKRQSNLVETYLNPPPIKQELEIIVDHRDNSTHRLLDSDEYFLEKGSTYTEKAKTNLKHSDGRIYRYARATPTNSSVQTGTLNDNMTLTFYYDVEDPPLETWYLTVQHRVDDTREVLDETVKSMTEGDFYYENARTDFTDENGDKYEFVRATPDNTSPQSGYMNTDKTLIFYYKLVDKVIPKQKLTVRHVDMATNSDIVKSISKELDKGSTYTEYARGDLRDSNNGRYSFYSATPDNSSKQTGVMNTDKTLIFYYKVNEHDLTIRHIDIDTNAVVKKEVKVLKDGQSYTEYAKDNLKKGPYSYKKLAPTVQSGKINGASATIDFFYRVPKLTLDNKGIHIFTNKKGDKQPVDVFLSSTLGTGSVDSDFKGGRVELSVTDTSNKDKVVYSSIKNIEGIKDKYSFDIPNDYLDKDTKTKYQYKVNVVNIGNNGYELITGTDVVNTHGYTASEYEITNADKNGSGDAKFVGVVLTEADTASKVKEFKETVVINKIAQPKVKSGYEYSFEPRVTYSMDTDDLATRVKDKLTVETDSKPIMDIDEDVVDLTEEYVADNTNNKKVSVKLDINPDKDSNVNQKRDITYRLPKGYLNREIGKIDFNNPVNALEDAGHNLYVPIWIKDLKKYDAVFESSEGIGVNKIGFSLLNKIDVYAYMISHIDSDTKDLDEILIHPMDQDDPAFGF